MKLFRLAAVIGIGVCVSMPTSSVSAGFGATSMVIDIQETTVEIGQDAIITVALQSVSAGSCEMEGDLELVLDSAALPAVELLDPAADGVNEYTFAIEMTALGDHTVNANFTPRDIELPNGASCLAPGLQLDQVITVVPASTTTTIEDEVTTTTAEEVPESVEDSVPATLAKAGASNGSSFAIAALVLIVAGAGFALIRRRS